MPTLKQIYAINGETAQAQYDAINQAAFDLIDASGVTWAGAAFHNYALKHWPKSAGTKPTAAMLSMNGLVDLVRRQGRECLALAMGLRPEGVSHATGGDYRSVPFADGCYPGGAAHNNIAQYTDQVREGRTGMCWFARIVSSGGGHSERYRYVITDKGMAQLTKGIAARGGTIAAVTPVKPVKVKAKANKKPAPVDAPVDAPAADVPQGDTSLPATPNALADLAAHFNS